MSSFFFIKLFEVIITNLKFEFLVNKVPFNFLAVFNIIINNCQLIISFMRDNSNVVVILGNRKMNVFYIFK